MNEEIINKELLSLVLEKDICEIVWIKHNKNKLQYDVEEDIDYTKLNLDTLGRLCKEWCLKQEWIISSNINGVDYKGDGVGFAYLQDFEYKHDRDKLRFKGETELEAIIKATEWVAREKGQLA